MWLAWPGVSRKLRSMPLASQIMWILLVRSPQLRPSAWVSTGSSSRPFFQSPAEVRVARTAVESFIQVFRSIRPSWFSRICKRATLDRTRHRRANRENAGRPSTMGRSALACLARRYPRKNPEDAFEHQPVIRQGHPIFCSGETCSCYHL